MIASSFCLSDGLRSAGGVNVGLGLGFGEAGDAFAAFDCAKGSMGVDYVICASPELMDAEARLEDALHAAHVAKGDQVKTEQWAWIKRYDCGLPFKGRPPEEKIHGAAGCVREAMEQRIKELQAEQQRAWFSVAMRAGRRAS